MALESRACYGYYGTGHGATGEEQPKTHARGWHIWTFYFVVRWPNRKRNECVQVDASCYKNALKNLKRWQKRDGFEIIGDAPGHEKQKGIA